MYSSTKCNYIHLIEHIKQTVYKKQTDLFLFIIFIKIHIQIYVEKQFYYISYMSGKEINNTNNQDNNNNNRIRAISPPLNQVNTTATIINNPKSVWAPARKRKPRKSNIESNRYNIRDLDNIKQKLIF